MRNSSFGALALLILLIVVIVVLLTPQGRHSVSSTPGPLWADRP